MDTLVVIGPTPPPFHGVAFSTRLVIDNPLLRHHFEVVHLDTSDRRSIENMGRWDVQNIGLGLRSLAKLLRVLPGKKGVTYLPLSETLGGFARDSLFIWASHVMGWKTAVHIRNSLFREFYGSQPRLARWWIRRTLRIVTGVAVLGESLRWLMDGFVQDFRLVVVPNGTPEFNRPKVEEDHSLVLYLSNLCRKKGADHAVRSALIVAEQDTNARFVFAGGWESTEIEEELRNLALPLVGRLEFVGPVAGAERARLMASARVLLFPVAWGEGHPRILLEALAAGLPAVTTNRATIAETIVDGETGFVLDNPAPSELAARVLEVLHDNSLRARLSAAARKRYLERFTQEQADRTIADWLTTLA